MLGTCRGLSCSHDQPRSRTTTHPDPNTLRRRCGCRRRGVRGSRRVGVACRDARFASRDRGTLVSPAYCRRPAAEAAATAQRYPHAASSGGSAERGGRPRPGRRDGLRRRRPGRVPPRPCPARCAAASRDRRRPAGPRRVRCQQRLAVRGVPAAAPARGSRDVRLPRERRSVGRDAADLRYLSGNAVDIGPPAAARWLSAHSAGYGLCQIYANEPWHYELRPAAVDWGCPARYPDPTHDPRMQR